MTQVTVGKGNSINDGLKGRMIELMMIGNDMAKNVGSQF